MDIVDVWRKAYETDPPHLFPGDDFLLDSEHANFHKCYEEFARSIHFNLRNDQTLHLGLTPCPYIGNLMNAKIFLLLLNPGLKPVDYYAQFSSEPYREAVKRNLLQVNASDNYPFFFLNPEFAWTDGFTYWEGKFHWLAAAISKQHGISYQEGLSEVAKRVCALELIPYASPSYGLPAKIESALTSVVAMRDHVRKNILPRARRGEVGMIVTRHANKWDITKSRHIVVYSGIEARAAHLSPGSRGGSLMSHMLELRT